MSTQELTTTILKLIDSKKEGVYWNFKAQYSVETKSIDLIHDIICLANADHDGDRFQRTDNDHGMEHHNFEWARGEIGYHYNQYANSTSLFELCYHNTPLAYIALATFDAGKKTIVAPEWFPVEQGRFYCYLEDSLEYIYQHYFLVGHQHHKDDSIELSYTSTKPDNIRESVFSIPVLKNQQDLEAFINFAKGKLGIIGTSSNTMPLTDEDKQNQFFYQLVEYHKQYSRLSKYEIS